MRKANIYVRDLLAGRLGSSGWLTGVSDILPGGSTGAQMGRRF
ncbi:MAG: hypothetical protein ACI4AI_04790 [Paludibacteraceae bacterium]